MTFFTGEDDIFDVIWDTEKKRTQGTSEMYKLDPTLKEEHARMLAKMIAEKLDELGYM